VSADPTLRDIVLRMEGTMNTAFATLRGDINLLRRDDTAMAEEVTEIKSDVEDLKRRRWPLPVIGGIMSVTAVALSAFTLVRGG